ncbi:hypothetical protein [Azospirillum argentinense]
MSLPHTCVTVCIGSSRTSRPARFFGRGAASSIAEVAVETMEKFPGDRYTEYPSGRHPAFERNP